MVAATTSKRSKEKTKLLVLEKNKKIFHRQAKNLIDYMTEGDLVIVNRSGTLPASFRGFLDTTKEFIEVRLASFKGRDPSDLRFWQAFTFGAGTWRDPTEKRKEPPQVKVGDKIIFSKSLTANIVKIYQSRFVLLKFSANNLVANLYKNGRPIQYSYLNESLHVWDQQTLFSGPAISVEPASASFALTWNTLFEMQKKGVIIKDLLHSAGLSSTGSPKLDRLLPLNEWYSIPDETVKEYLIAKKNRNKIFAIGTTVLRALESSWNGYSIESGHGVATLKITNRYKIKSVTNLVTGMHELGTSHRNLLHAFCSQSQIKEGYRQAIKLGYKNHEYGDLTLLNCLT